MATIKKITVPSSEVVLHSETFFIKSKSIYIIYYVTKSSNMINHNIRFITAAWFSLSSKQVFHWVPTGSDSNIIRDFFSYYDYETNCIHYWTILKNATNSNFFSTYIINSWLSSDFSNWYERTLSVNAPTYWRTTVIRTSIDKLFLYSWCWDGPSNNLPITFCFLNMTNWNLSFKTFYSWYLTGELEWWLESDDISNWCIVISGAGTTSEWWWKILKIKWDVISDTGISLIDYKMINWLPWKKSFFIKNNWKEYIEFDRNLNINTTTKYVNSYPTDIELYFYWYWSSSNLQFNVLNTTINWNSNHLIIWHRSGISRYSYDDNLWLSFENHTNWFLPSIFQSTFLRDDSVIFQNDADWKVYIIKKSNMNIQVIDKKNLFISEWFLPAIIKSQGIENYRMTSYKTIDLTSKQWIYKENSKSVSQDWVTAGKIVLNYLCLGSSWWTNIIIWLFNITNDFEQWYSESIEYIKNFNWFIFNSEFTTTNSNDYPVDYTVDWIIWKKVIPNTPIYEIWSTKIKFRFTYNVSSDKSDTDYQNWYTVWFF